MDNGASCGQLIVSTFNIRTLTVYFPRFIPQPQQHVTKLKDSFDVAVAPIWFVDADSPKSNGILKYYNDIISNGDCRVAAVCVL